MVGQLAGAGKLPPPGTWLSKLRDKRCESAWASTSISEEHSGGQGDICPPEGGVHGFGRGPGRCRESDASIPA